MVTPDPEAEWWTTTDVAAYLDVSVSAVSGYRNRATMPAPDAQIGRTWVWRPARIIEWHAARPRVHARRQLRHGSDGYRTRPGTRETAFTKAEDIGWDDYELKKRFEHVPASERLAGLFAVEAGTPLLTKHFVFFARGEPRQISTSHLLASMVDGTPVADPDREPWPGGTIDQMRTLGVTVTEVIEAVESRRPTAVERSTLAVPRGGAVFSIVRRHVDDTGRVVEVADPIVIPADRASLVYRFPV